MLLYADEDFPFPAVEELRQLGHDVLTAQEDGRTARGACMLNAPLPRIRNRQPEQVQQT
jgi:hypothetical protein